MMPVGMDAAQVRQGLGMAADDEDGQWRRLGAILACLVAATLGYAVAEALSRAGTSDAFMVAPTLAQLGRYGLALLTMAGLALALEMGGPPIVARGGRAARGFRAAIRRRFRRGRTRAEIGNVEVGLTISFCAVLMTLAFMFATLKAFLVLVMVVAVVANLQAIASFCRLVRYDPTWSALIGFLYGMGAGAVMT